MPLSEICIPIYALGACNCLTLARPVQQRKAGKELAFGMTGGSRINRRPGSYWTDGPSSRSAVPRWPWQNLHTVSTQIVPICPTLEEAT